jgi:hypothetical protein
VQGVQWRDGAAAAVGGVSQPLCGVEPPTLLLTTTRHDERPQKRISHAGLDSISDTISRISFVKYRSIGASANMVWK